MDRASLQHVISIALLLHALACAIAALLTVTWLVIGGISVGFEAMPVASVGLAVLFAANTVAILWVKGALSKGKASRLHIGLYFAVSVLGFFCSMGFYSDIMHDLALTFFDSHGRFGCTTIEGGYWLTSSTLPWISFATEPIIVAICLMALPYNVLRT